MSKIDAVKEDVSLMSKLLMASAGTTVVTVGGVAGLFISGQVGPVFTAGVIAMVVLFCAIFCGLFVRVEQSIRLLEGL